MRGLATVLVAASVCACRYDFERQAGGDGDLDLDGARDAPSDAGPRALRLYGHSIARLVTIDPSSVISQEVALTVAGGPAAIQELAVDSQGVIIGQTDAEDELYRIDPASGACVRVARLSTGATTAFRGMAFVPAGVVGPEERLLGRDYSGVLYDIDVGTGLVAERGRAPIGLATAGDLVWVPQLGLLASVRIDGQTNDAFAQIDPATGATTLLGSGDAGAPAIEGLAELGGEVWAFVGPGAVHRVSLTTFELLFPAETTIAGLNFEGGGAMLLAP